MRIHTEMQVARNRELVCNTAQGWFDVLKDMINPVMSCHLEIKSPMEVHTGNPKTAGLHTLGYIRIFPSVIALKSKKTTLNFLMFVLIHELEHSTQESSAYYHAQENYFVIEHDCNNRVKAFVKEHKTELKSMFPEVNFNAVLYFASLDGLNDATQLARRGRRDLIKMTIPTIDSAEKLIDNALEAVTNSADIIKAYQSAIASEEYDTVFLEVSTLFGGTSGCAFKVEGALNFNPEDVYKVHSALDVPAFVTSVSNENGVFGYKLKTLV